MNKKKKAKILTTVLVLYLLLCAGAFTAGYYSKRADIQNGKAEATTDEQTIQSVAEPEETTDTETDAPETAAEPTVTVLPTAPDDTDEAEEESLEEEAEAVPEEEPRLPVGVDAAYTKPFYEGEIPDPEYTDVYVHYNDDTKEKVREFTGLPEEAVFEETDITIHTTFGDASFTLAPHPIVSVAPKDTGWYEYDSFAGCDISLIYDDETVLDADPAMVEYINPLPKTLTLGYNDIGIRYHGKEFHMLVVANANTYVTNEARKYADEYEAADYRYRTDTIYTTVTHYETDQSSFFLSHIIIYDTDQIRGGLSYDDYGGERETPSSASKRLHWVIGTNASNFDYATDKPDMGNVRIKEGKIMSDSKTAANGREICLTADGTLFSAEEGQSAESLIAMGVWNTFCCGDTELIKNGVAVNVGVQSQQYRYPRTAIGMVKPHEYYLITAGDGTYEKGMTYDEVRNVLLSKGCVFGKCMDGGGSVALVFRDELVNRSPDTERPVIDYLYFVEGEEEQSGRETDTPAL